MSNERLVREALEHSVNDLPCPEPDIEQLLAAGRTMRRRRVQVVASMAAAAAVLLILTGLSFFWAGQDGRASEPVPANATTSGTIEAASTSEQQQWIDALPAGAPPTTPYWHDGTLYVNGAQIPAPYTAVDIDVAGDTVLVGGYEREPQASAPSQWMLVRGDGLEPVTVPAGTGDVGLSVDGRIAYWVVTHQPGTKQFVTLDTETNTLLPSRTVNGPRVGLMGVDASGIGYWQTDQTDGGDRAVTRWDVRADTVHPTDLVWDPGQPLELFDGFVPWLHPSQVYRSPDGTRTLFTDSIPRGPTTWSGQPRVRQAGPPDSVDPEDVITVALSQALLDAAPVTLGEGNGYWTWWESNESVLLSVDGDSHTFLLRCSVDGAACQRVADLGPGTTQSDASLSSPAWARNWGFARAPVSQ